MILAALALLLPAPAPVVPFAEARSIAYRDCVAAALARSPGQANVAEAGKRACAGPRSRLVSQVRGNISYGWAAVTKTSGQRKRLREHLRAKAEEEVASFEGRIRDWIEGRAR
jgi:hypothetical protein